MFDRTPASSVDADHLKCISFGDGDWIIFRCPHCKYEMRENWRTGKMTVKNTNPNAKHFGGYFPEGY